MNDDRPANQLPRHHVGTIAFVSLLAVIVLLFAYLSLDGYRTAQRESHGSAVNLVGILGAGFENTLDRTVGDLQGLARQVRAGDLSGSMSEVRRSDLVTAMDDSLRRFPQVTAYQLVDAAGRLFFAAGAAAPRSAAFVVDSPWFQRLRDDQDQSLVLSGVLAGNDATDETLIMAIPIRDGQGRFLGAANAVIDLGYFQHLVDGLSIGAHGLVAVRRTDDFTLILRHPRRAELVNRPPQSVSTVFGMVRAGQTAGAINHESAVDGVTRVVAFRSLADYPLTVIVGLAARDYLVPWLKQTVSSGVATLALILAIVLLHRRQQALSALQASEIFKSAILNSSSSQIAVLDRQGAIVDCNDAWRRFATENGLAPTQFALDSDIGAGYVGIDPNSGATAHQTALDAYRGVSAVLEGRSTNYNLEYPCHSAAENRWFSMVVTPLGSGRIEGAVITRTDVSRFQLVTEQLRIAATTFESQEEKIQLLAFFDQLTGLPNRTLLEDRLKQAINTSSRNSTYAALLLIDIDNFKTINDTLGHDKGDLLLKQVAQRLTLCVREDDTVSRLGGDEFLLVLVGLSPTESEAANQVEVIGEAILESLNNSYLINDAPYYCTPSIGATVFEGPIAWEDLLKQADLAMYKAKAAGRNALRFFDPELETAVMARAWMETDLRGALRQKQFIIHYQPQILATGLVTGVEALTRWRHPHRGMVSPADFIPLAEETGLILPLGNWVLDTACRQLAEWAKKPSMAHLTVAVNVSARQFHQPDFVDQVLAALKRSGANPLKLKLELTESLLVENLQDIVAKMSDLQSVGVGFSLDDFGTGYSSLSYLQRLPLDQLKIDQSFVRDVLTDPNNAAIARTIVALAQSLGLGVIAEGVETAEQHDFLANCGCNAYQGFFFSRPLPAEEFAKYHAEIVRQNSPATEPAPPRRRPARRR